MDYIEGDKQPDHMFIEKENNRLLHCDVKNTLSVFILGEDTNWTIVKGKNNIYVIMLL